MREIPIERTRACIEAPRSQWPVVDPDYRRDLVSLLIVEDVVYSPRWTWEVEQIIEVPPDRLPPDMAPVARAWIDAVIDKL